MKTSLSKLKSLNKNLSEIEMAILATVAYFDIFDFPLTASEIHQNLIQVALPRVLVISALKGEHLRGYLTYQNGYYVFQGREQIINIRSHRLEISQRTLWPLAIKYGWLIANLPFIRMVGITGSLSMNNARRNSDIDFFIVTQAHRVWVSRLLVFILQKISTLNSTLLCPNYIISEQNLALNEQDLFTAYQITQMIPITNASMYRRILQSNPWISRFLPNARNGQNTRKDFLANQPLKKLAEIVLNSPIGIWLDRGERARVINKYGNDEATPSETSFLPEIYKGHFSGHAQRTQNLFLERLGDVLS